VVTAVTVRASKGTAPVQQRTAFHSPPLVRLLAGLDQTPPPDPARPQANVGERLGQWLAWTDAIALSQALNQPPAQAPGRTAAASIQARAAAALARVRDDLRRAALQDPVVQHDTTTSASADLADYRRYAQARQRAMAAAIGPLRAQLRGLLATTSAAGAHLAALDATLEAALGEREHHSLAGVMPRLERHFQQLQQAQAPHWRDSFHQTLQQALLAELDLRLQPAQGLLDALGEAA
jgi:hypothetical protein